MAKYRKQVIPTDWDEELFEGKNKAYGGYRLRKNAGKRLLFGWLITITAFLLVCWSGFAIQVKEKEVVDRQSVIDKEKLIICNLRPLVRSCPTFGTWSYKAPQIEPDSVPLLPIPPEKVDADIVYCY